MTPKQWIIQELLSVTTAFLRKREIECPRLSAEILLAAHLHVDRLHLYLSFDKPLTSDEVDGYRTLIKRRINREPIQYITGTQEFWSMDFAVNCSVLIPRPESELLVEQTLSLIPGELPQGTPNPRILDLGTGSGALAVTLAKELEAASVWASDISRQALDQASLNAQRHGVEERIHFIQGDLFSPFAERSIGFDIIVANPPYIVSEEYDSLSPEIRDFEPRQALDGGEDGMFFIRSILTKGPEHLNAGGWVVIEMDPRQTEEAIRLISDSGAYGKSMRIRDYSGRYRVVMAQRR